MTEKIFISNFSQNLKTYGLMAALAVIMAAPGWLFAGWLGFFAALFLGLAYFTLSPRLAPALVMRLQGVRPVSPYQAPQTYRLLDALGSRAGLSVAPELYYQEDPRPNAFAVSLGKQSAVAVSSGLLLRLDRRELAGTLAHEVSHIANGDLEILGLADSLARLTRTLSTISQIALLFLLPVYVLTGQSPSFAALLFLIFSPGLSYLLRLAISRTREFQADLGAARLTGDPLALASALGKLENAPESFWDFFLPRRKTRDLVPEALRTHPDTAERIRRLRELAVDSSSATREVIEPEIVQEREPYGEPARGYGAARVIRRPRITMRYY